jgi:hypothetical protein
MLSKSRTKLNLMTLESRLTPSAATELGTAEIPTEPVAVELVAPIPRREFAKAELAKPGRGG